MCMCCTTCEDPVPSNPLACASFQLEDRLHYDTGRCVYIQSTWYKRCNGMEDTPVVPQYGLCVHPVGPLSTSAAAWPLRGCSCTELGEGFRCRFQCRTPGRSATEYSAGCLVVPTLFSVRAAVLYCATEGASYAVRSARTGLYCSHSVSRMAFTNIVMVMHQD